jgi:hypothetical protein
MSADREVVATNIEPAPPNIAVSNTAHAPAGSVPMPTTTEAMTPNTAPVATW